MKMTGKIYQNFKTPEYVMESNSSLSNRIDLFSKIHHSIYGKMKTFAKMITQVELKSLKQIRHFFVSLVHKSEETLLKFLRDCNNKLNIYTEIKREYKIQNIMEENLIYMIGVNDGSYKSIIKILIISAQNDNQQNYFNC